MKGKQLSVVQSMAYWNIQGSTSACCPFHNYISEVIAVCAALTKRPCIADFSTVSEAQCEECGILNEWSEDDDNSSDGVQTQLRECEMCFARAVRRRVQAPGAHVVQL